MKLATPKQMQALDRAAIKDFGIPGLVLMENAGRTILDVMEDEFGPVSGKTVCIFIGPGNNGGDGLVVARHVLQRGGFPFLILLVEPDKLQGDAAINAEICSKLWLNYCLVNQERDFIDVEARIRQLHFEHPIHSLVDALFGTGLTRTIEGRFATAIQFMNKLSCQKGWPIAAVDIPSGLSGLTGTPLGDIAVQAHLTVTFGLPKPGHYLHRGETVGKLYIADIGIPPQVIAAAHLPGELLNQLSVTPLLRSRPKAGHKGTFGHVLILAGSEGKTGAALLAAQAALRSGCGLVTLAVPAALNPIFETALPEAMTVPLPHSGKCLSVADYQIIAELVKDKDAIVIGPGIGTAPETSELLLRLHRRVSLPILLDADALNLLSQNLLYIEDCGGPRILTPHPGEMARLTGLTTAEVQADRLKAADWLSEAIIKNGCEIITVLKGAGTVVCSNRGHWAINSSGNSGLAVGGTGDVLSGLIGGLLAQGHSLWEAAAAGVFLHGLAGDLLAQERSQGFTASELAAMLPLAFMKCQETVTRRF